MLRHLAERASRQRLMILATARPEDIERSNPTLKKCYTEMHARGLCGELALAALKRQTSPRTWTRTIRPTNSPRSWWP